MKKEKTTLKKFLNGEVDLSQSVPTQNCLCSKTEGFNTDMSYYGVCEWYDDPKPNEPYRQNWIIFVLDDGTAITTCLSM